MNKPLTPEEAKNLTFPCLLEVWDYQPGTERCAIIVGITFAGHFKDTTGLIWKHAALPSPEITAAMRKQFGVQSKYPKQMLVWDCDEENAVERIVIADLGEKAIGRYIVVFKEDESKFDSGREFGWFYFRNAKPIPEPDPISKEIEEMRQRLADLEAKHNQQL